MGSSIRDLEAFVTVHRACGRLGGDADLPVPEGYRFWVACSCGARFERWITPEVADQELLTSVVLGSPN